jgi:hypothetical protein
VPTAAPARVPLAPSRIQARPSGPTYPPDTLLSAQTLGAHTESFCCPYFCAGALELGVAFTDIDTLPYPK